MATNKPFISRILDGLIVFYQRGISPFVGGHCACRFTPTCSEYARQSIAKYGPKRGIKMAFDRICRCRPGGDFGYDPVP